MVSSSLDGTIRIGELERRQRQSRQLGETDRHGGKKGIYCFDWSNNFKVHFISILIRASHDAPVLVFKFVHSMYGLRSNRVRVRRVMFSMPCVPGASFLRPRTHCRIVESVYAFEQTFGCIART